MLSLEALVLTVSLASYHLDRTEDYNEVNLGVGFEYHLNENRSHYITGGFYDNSYDDNTYYLGGGFTKIRATHRSGLTLNWGWEAGLMYGYDTALPVMPYILPRVTVVKDNWQVKFLTIIEVSAIQVGYVF